MKYFSYYISLLVFLFLFHDAKSQTSQNIKDTITWAILNNVEYKESPHKDYGTVYLPTFSSEIKKTENKNVIIKGYLVPVDKSTWALSKNTYAACFFCGKAGPETVLGLTFKGDPGKLKMDANVTLSGKFILNGTDVDDWMYSLKDAEIVSKN